MRTIVLALTLAVTGVGGRAYSQVPVLPDGALTHWSIDGPEEIVTWLVFDPAGVDHLIPAGLRFITVGELAKVGIAWAADQLLKDPSRAEWGISFLEIVRTESFTIDGDAPTWPQDGAAGLWFARVRATDETTDLGSGQPFLALEFWLPDSAYVARIREKGHYATYGNVVLRRNEEGKWHGMIDVDGLRVIAECKPTGPILGGPGSAGRQVIVPPKSSMASLVQVAFAGHQVQRCEEGMPWTLQGSHPLASSESVGVAEFQFGYSLIGGVFF
jgi:hypothetical protein